MTADTNARYSIYRDESLTDVQGDALITLKTYQQQLYTALLEVQKDTARAIENIAQGLRPGYATTIYGHSTMNVEMAAAKAEVQAHACIRLGIPAETVQTVLCQAGTSRF
jgi:SAM-dependent MidA family methyltransferase